MVRSTGNIYRSKARVARDRHAGEDADVGRSQHCL